MKVLVAALLFGALFIAVEFISKWRATDAELSRKFIHVTAGVMAACLPLFLSFSEIQLLSLMFIPIMVVSRRRNIFKAIHNVRRSTLGEVYFPLSIFLVASFFPNTTIYLFGLLVMAIGDGFASIFGQRYGKRKYRLWYSSKSFLGSSVLFGCAFILGFICLQGESIAFLPSLLYGAAIALGLTLVEAGLSYGLDNLILPLCASLLLSLALSLA